MRPVLLLFFIAFSTKGYSQNIEEFVRKLKLNLNSYAAVEKLVTRPGKEMQEFKLTYFSKRYNYFEIGVADFRIEYNGSGFSLAYNLDIAEKDDTLLHLSLQKTYDSREDSNNLRYIFYHYDSLSAKIFADRFNKKFNTAHTWIEQFDRTEYDEYGISWGLIVDPERGPYEPMRNVFDMVERKDISGLETLCHSLCNETKAYGATGLYLLSVTDYRDYCLDELFNAIRQSGNTVYFAPGGCIVLGSTPMSTALSDDFLREVYTSFKDYQKAKK